MEAIPAYNPHLLADVGALFVATGALMLMAALWLERRLVLAALITWLLFAVPHVIYHLGNLGPYDTADTRQRGHARPDRADPGPAGAARAPAPA